MNPYRTPWGPFPDVIIHAPETTVKRHPAYEAAKGGDIDEAARLVAETASASANEALHRSLHGRAHVILLSAHALERQGVNMIPEALAEHIGRALHLPVEHEVVQINIVRHTGASGYGRLARQALFDGPIVAGASYVLVDDFVGQGGTLANLRGYVLHCGGQVIAATVLTGKDYSARLALTAQTLDELRHKHGKEFEYWWEERFGHAFDCLTESEARYLSKSPDADTIRDRIVEEEQAGGERAPQGNP